MNIGVINNRNIEASLTAVGASELQASTPANIKPTPTKLHSEYGRFIFSV